MIRKLQVGLIGYGYAGRTFHVPVLTSVASLRLAKVVDRRGTFPKEQYPDVEVLGDVRELYEDRDIDLIIVTTPSTNHYEFIKDGLLAGKHVVVEKPFTVTSKEADELIALAREQGKVLSVFHNRRWDGDFLTIKVMIQQDLLGKLRECEFHWDGFDPVVISGNWRETAEAGAGVLYDLGVHLIDQALCLFGLPDSVEGDVRIQRNGGLATDYFHITLRYLSGLKVLLKSSRFVRTNSPRYVLYGERGTFVKYGTDPQEAALIQGKTPVEDLNWGKESKEQWGRLNTTVGGLHVEGTVETLAGSYPSYYQNVFEHISGAGDLAVKPEQARAAVRIVELAMQSHTQVRILPYTE